MKIGILFALSIMLSSQALNAQSEQPVVVGSKKFTESVTLGEIIRLSLQRADIPARHSQELGGTRILWNALMAGQIDAYVEYTGTLSEEVFKEKIGTHEELEEKLRTHGIGAFKPLGFNNTYAIGMKKGNADKLNISRISDLASHPRLKFGFGEEFRLRKDGWPALKEKYRLPQRLVRGLDHDIAYRALESGDIDVTDLYSTDAEIAYYDLRILEDNLDYFPRYEALVLYRLETADRFPAFRETLSRLTGSISNEKMIEMNREAKIRRAGPGDVATRFLNDTFSLDVQHKAASRSERIFVRIQEHVMLVLISLLAAILTGVPLGIFAEKMPGIGKIILGTVGIIQTIPALALLVVLIRPLNAIGLSGIGDTPALIALFLYSLLPIVRGTHTGLEQIPLHLRETAAVLGLSGRTRLLVIQLPLALPSILSGIKTSAVLNVGFATLGALVGAGGLGQPILTGIRLDDYGLILEGALPAAILAIIVQGFFDLIDDRVVSPGLRSK